MLSEARSRLLSAKSPSSQRNLDLQVLLTKKPPSRQESRKLELSRIKSLALEGFQSFLG